jgi:hypothetical protein
VAEMLSLLSFPKTDAFHAEELGRVDEWRFFDKNDYRSWSGVDLWLYKGATGLVVVETRTSIGRG